MLTTSEEHERMVAPPRRLATFEVKCLLCGRAAGQVVNRIYIAQGQTRAPIWTKLPRCGECGGNLLAEPVDPSG